ncbi:MAG TPA: glycosyltransferase N-terminal domain-containing protein [Thermoanaerobaculia bacterium]|nr:glycosyltransferase N-terminal domain-containing protein [Thermoanaerobaculia bacterium]
MWLLYQLGLALALAVAAPGLLATRGRHYLPTLRGRLARELPERPGEHPLWIHAVSVGEVAVAATVVRALPPDLPIVLTTVTPTGRTRAEQLLGDRCALAYLPFDLAPPVRRFLDRVRPSGLVLVEGELWPLLLRHLRRRGIPVRMINGRVSDRSFGRMRRLRPLLGPLLATVERFGVQTAGDRDRLTGLGVEATRLAVTGNLKFEIGVPPPLPETEGLVVAAAAGRPLLVAGSTMPGEEEQVLRAFARLGGGERALLLLAPRHPERCASVVELARGAGLAVSRRSALDGAAPKPRADVVVLDTLGELAALYRLAAGAFVGGTLVPTGGHNPLEASCHGVAVAVGPSMHNFREMAETYDRAGAWRRVADPAQLAAAWSEWLERPETAGALGAAGRALIDANRGALRRTLDLLEPLLARREGAAG